MEMGPTLPLRVRINLSEVMSRGIFNFIDIGELGLSIFESVRLYIVFC